MCRVRIPATPIDYATLYDVQDKRMSGCIIYASCKILISAIKIYTDGETSDANGWMLKQIAFEAQMSLQSFDWSVSAF